MCIVKDGQLDLSLGQLPDMTCSLPSVESAFVPLFDDL